MVLVAQAAAPGLILLVWQHKDGPHQGAVWLKNAVSYIRLLITMCGIGLLLEGIRVVGGPGQVGIVT